GDTHGSIAINNLSTDTSNLFIGEVVSGSGIAAGTVITNIVDSHAITISKPTLSSLTSTSLTFSDGELMFESIDTVQVKLGGGDQTHFTINNTITGMTAVTGGTAGDILDVVGTNTTQRNDSHFNGVVNVAVTTTGTTGATVSINAPDAALSSHAGAFTLTFNDGKNDARETGAIPFGATKEEVTAALEHVSTIGSGNVDVTGTGKVGDPYVITFKNQRAGVMLTQRASLTGAFTPLLLQGGDGVNTFNIHAITQDTWIVGGETDDFINVNVQIPTDPPNTLVPNTTNGVNALLSIDSIGGPGDAHDTENIYYIGGFTHPLLTVHDTKQNTSLNTNTLNVFGAPEISNTFLLRAGAGALDFAFIASINLAGNVERINYDETLDAITLYGGQQGDKYFIDDTKAHIDIFAGGAAGTNAHNSFQIGQLYQSQRTHDFANVDNADQFNTLLTTKGWLSNGISSTMSIHGGDAGDNFVVFHNKEELSLFGGAGNDSFIIQAFALAGSQDDVRKRTSVHGGAGNSL